MKTRIGFVSNSSSSSFVIMVKDLDRTVVDYIHKALGQCEEECSDDTYVNYGKDFYFGKVSYHSEHWGELREYMKKQGVLVEVGD